MYVSNIETFSPIPRYFAHVLFTNLYIYLVCKLKLYVQTADQPSHPRKLYLCTSLYPTTYHPSQLHIQTSIQASLPTSVRCSMCKPPSKLLTPTFSLFHVRSLSKLLTRMYLCSIFESPPKFFTPTLFLCSMCESLPILSPLPCFSVPLYPYSPPYLVSLYHFAYIYSNFFTPTLFLCSTFTWHVGSMLSSSRVSKSVIGTCTTFCAQKTCAKKRQRKKRRGGGGGETKMAYGEKECKLKKKGVTGV